MLSFLNALQKLKVEIQRNGVTIEGFKIIEDVLKNMDNLISFKMNSRGNNMEKESVLGIAEALSNLKFI